MPWLRGEGCERLDRCPGAAGPFVEHLVNIVAIGSMTRSNSSGNQVGILSQGEEFGVLAAAERQPCIFDEAIMAPAINRGAGIAVAAIHVRRRALNIHRQLRYEQILRALKCERQNGARAAGG